MLGKSLAHYDIVAKLGAGGMGEVYHARDRKLGRDVALKLLPTDVSADPERVRRLKHEARAVAALSHPNIVTMYAIEEADGVQFLAMEFVDGQSLDSVIPEDGLSPERVLEIAIPLADALAAAHAVGVVHRDLKPANVIIDTNGRPKILDFGIAKTLGPTDGAQLETDAPTRTRLTREGTVIGTLPYMSPEQVLGSPVDARTDIFSFGTMLYEMSTGKRPFTGQGVALASAVLKDTPPSISVARPGFPDDLQTIISRCLEKDREARYPTCRTLHDALVDARNDGRSVAPLAADANPEAKPARAGVASVLGRIVGALRTSGSNDLASDALAILPFDTTSDDPEAEYLSDGVTEGLINRLGLATDLRVMSRHSVFRFKGQRGDPQEIGRQLGVASIVTGRFDLRGNTLAIGVELTNVKDGTHLWGERFDRTRSDVARIEREIVKRIGQRMGVALPDDATLDGSSTRDVDPETYGLYAKGRHFLTGSTSDELARAERFFLEAIDHDPSYAAPYAGLASCYVIQAWLTSSPHDDILPRARAAAARALELDRDLSDVYVATGEIKTHFDWDWRGAETDFLRAIELNPNNDAAHREYSQYLAWLGRFDEAIDAGRKAQALDPLSTHATHILAYSLLVAKRYPEAIAEFKKAIELNANWIWGYIKLGKAYSESGDHEKAMACVADADALIGDRLATPLAQSWLAQIEWAAGDERRLRETVRRLETPDPEKPVDQLVLATLYTFVERDEDALDALERAFEARSPLMVAIYLLREEAFRRVRDTYRFRRLLQALRFPTE